MNGRCLFCGGDRSEPDHDAHCDGRQGAMEAELEGLPSRTSYDREAAAFHLENPHVMEKLIELARELHRRGINRAGIKLLFERLRWINVVETEGDKYRLNDHYTAWYSRQVMAADPKLAGLFETRAGPHDPHYYDRPIRRKKTVSQ